METSIPLRAISIAPSGLHVATWGFINGQLANVLIDTGASQTVLDKNRVHIFSLQTEFELSDQLSKGLGTAEMQSYLFNVDQFVLGDVVLDHLDVMLIDLQHVNSSYQQLGHTAIDMVLGGDILQRYEAVLDYGKMTMTLTIP